MEARHGAGRPAYRSGHCHDGCASVFEALGWVGALRLDSRHVRHGRGLMAITLFLPFRLDLDLFPCTHREVGLKETFREEYYRTLFGAMQPSECPPLLVSSVARHKLAGSNCCSYTQLHDTVI